MKKELQQERKCYECLKIEYDKSQEIAQIATRDVQVVRQELQEERERVQLLTEKFLRDVTSAESRATFAEVHISVSDILLVGSIYFLFRRNFS